VQLKKLAPTFGAEVTGVDFSEPVAKEVFDEIHRAIVDVCCSLPIVILYTFDWADN
jgi:alpha-ketoglutarate-dependent taurine dioxygenase